MGMQPENIKTNLIPKLLANKRKYKVLVTLKDENVY
jgi:hypothetical protein